jgi:hypothetical protein
MEEVPLEHHKKKQPLALGVEHGRLKKKRIVASQQFHGHGLRFERLIRLHNPTAAPKTSLGDFAGSVDNCHQSPGLNTTTPSSEMREATLGVLDNIRYLR